jgi:hypothetical protein
MSRVQLMASADQVGDHEGTKDMGLKLWFDPLC